LILPPISSGGVRGPGEGSLSERYGKVGPGNFPSSFRGPQGVREALAGIVLAGLDAEREVLIH
jgi:hypothetical protein